jgi:predicted HAD superfamily Cof-like phosphohydrolase
MTTQFPVLTHTKAWFEAARPLPVSKDIHSQLGCHFEEVKEMIDEVEGLDTDTQQLLDAAGDAIHTLAEHLKSMDGVIVVRHGNRIGMIDAIADQLVTATGVAHCLAMDPVGALNEVNRSNYSKFDDNSQPIYDPVTHKVIKGPNYSKADLTPYV